MVRHKSIGPDDNQGEVCRCSGCTEDGDQCNLKAKATLSSEFLSLQSWHSHCAPTPYFTQPTKQRAGA